MKKGDICYALGTKVRKVEVIRVMGNFYHVKDVERGSAFGVSGHRLITSAEYEKQHGITPVPKIEHSIAAPPLH